MQKQRKHFTKRPCKWWKALENFKKKLFLNREQYFADEFNEYSKGFKTYSIWTNLILTEKEASIYSIYSKKILLIQSVLAMIKDSYSDFCDSNNTASNQYKVDWTFRM